jgi:NAD(P)-dependent dehydrogenase (short-subunit alcohol dehydrogenase family)
MKTQWSTLRVLITGGTSGLGKALALELVKRGARVAVVARNSLGLEETAGRTRSSELIQIQADIAEKDDIYRISGQTLAQLGGIDLLINNASYLGETPLRLLADTDCEDFEKVFVTNVLGPFRLTKALLPAMLLQKSGTVLNISSDAAVNSYPGWGSYGTSKAALTHLSKIWNEEVKDQGVRFFAVDPGDMDTPMHAAAIPGADPASLLDPHEAALKLLALISEGA